MYIYLYIVVVKKTDNVLCQLLPIPTPMASS